MLRQEKEARRALGYLADRLYPKVFNPEQKYDWERLFELGWDVKRFWVYQIRDDLQGCIEQVRHWLHGSAQPSNRGKTHDRSSRSPHMGWRKVHAMPADGA